MVLAAPFSGLRPSQWSEVDHLQPRSRGFEAALSRAAADLEDRRRSDLALDPSPSGTVMWIDGGDARTARRTAGIVLSVRVDAEGADAVLPHERTFPDPVARRVRTRNVLRVDTNPNLLLLRDETPELDELLAAATGARPALHLEVGTEGHNAVATPVDDDLIRSLRGVPALIADGHHRIAAANDVDAHDRGTSMAWLVSASHPPRLFPVHRTVATLPAGALARLDEVGVQRTETAAAPGQQPVLVTAEGAQVLEIAPAGEAARRLADLPPTIRDLHVTFVDFLVHEVLGVGVRRDALGTTTDHAAAAEAVADGHADAAILACGPDLAEVWAAAEAGVRLPPKATWFGPKPRTGAILRPLG